MTFPNPWAPHGFTGGAGVSHMAWQSAGTNTWCCSDIWCVEAAGGCGLSTAGWGKPSGGVPPGFSHMEPTPIQWALAQMGIPQVQRPLEHHQSPPESNPSRCFAEVQPGTRLLTALVSRAQVGSEANSASLHVSPERDASFRASDLHGSDLRS